MTLYAAADSTDIQPLSHAAAVPRAGILRSKRGQCQTICKHRAVVIIVRDNVLIAEPASEPIATRARTGRRWTPPSPGRSFEGVLDFLVSAPEGLVEEADPEFDAERPRARVGVVEVLVHRHARRNVHRVSRLPVDALAVDHRIAVAFEDVQHRFSMRVLVASRMGCLLEDVRDRRGLRAEAVRLVGGALAASHEDPDARMTVRALARLVVLVPGETSRPLVDRIFEVE